MFSELIAVTFLLSLALCRFDANLFIVLPVSKARRNIPRQTTAKAITG